MAWLLLVPPLLLAAWWLVEPWQRSVRRARWRREPLPSAWRRVLRRRVPLIARLPADLQLRLKGLMQVFLREKRFVGCAGLRVTEEIRVVVAALACLPLLGHTRGYYPQLAEVLIYPSAFVAQRSHVDAAGVQHQGWQAMSGESWSRGQVVLAWDEVLAGAANADDGRNVVLHEFAHQLDQLKGAANGAPPLPDAAAYARWSGVMQTEFDALRGRLARGEPAGLLDPYGASEPAEFFAVASEVYFERGHEMAERHPALYRELAAYYRVDTAAWQA
ncbi:zinc-dependent peptidase [Inhella sp.]|uniref:M90 family metallopeptidase n=1 Tax=Inhella sp. TaxID=1921806 RepID=UPI0035AFE045